MLRANIRDTRHPDIGDEIYFWSDQVGWKGPTIATEIDQYGARFIHNGRSKSSAFNHIRRLLDQKESTTISDHDDTPRNPTGTVSGTSSDEDDESRHSGEGPTSAS